MGTDEVTRAVEAIRAGRPVLLPADGVYGLCGSPAEEASVRRLYELKGRDDLQPSAMITASIETLFEWVPELPRRDAVIVRTLLPGPYTLVLPNPAQRYPWLNGARPDTIGVRVVDLPADAQHVLDAVGAVVATSANDPGAPAAASLDEVSVRIRSGVAAEIDAGRLSGTPSTVIDFSGLDPVVLREGAASSAAAIALVAEALAADRF